MPLRIDSDLYVGFAPKSLSDFGLASFLWKTKWSTTPVVDVQEEKGPMVVIESTIVVLFVCRSPWCALM